MGGGRSHSAVCSPRDGAGWGGGGGCTGTQCMHTHVHTCMCTHTRAYGSTHTHTHTYMYVHATPPRSKIPAANPTPGLRTASSPYRPAPPPRGPAQPRQRRTMICGRRARHRPERSGGVLKKLGECRGVPKGGGVPVVGGLRGQRCPPWSASPWLGVRVVGGLPVVRGPRGQRSPWLGVVVVGGRRGRGSPRGWASIGRRSPFMEFPIVGGPHGQECTPWSGSP